MRGLALVGIVASALVAAPAASAKMCVTITPSRTSVVAGAAITIRVQTFEPDAAAATPFAVGRTALVLLLYRPDGVMVNPTLRRLPGDGSTWETRVTLRQVGLWRLRLADETAIPRACRGRTAVRVRRA